MCDPTKRPGQRQSDMCHKTDLQSDTSACCSRVTENSAIKSAFKKIELFQVMLAPEHAVCVLQDRVWAYW